MFGYWRRFLRVDLTEGRVVAESISPSQLERTIGGVGLAAEISHRILPPQADAFSPENVLFLATGPFQGTRFPGSAKWVACAKSPLTGSFFVSAAGGKFGPALKGSGVDIVAIAGRSDHPVILVISGGSAELLDGHELWGLETFDATEKLHGKWSDENGSVIVIGPAGEARVAIASLVADGYSFAGRGGLGAVMGDKHLKAVVAMGGSPPAVAAPKRLASLTREAALHLRNATRETYGKHGTANDLATCEAIGDLPLRYWAGHEWTSGAAKLSAPRYTEELHALAHPCSACPIGCHRRLCFTQRNGGRFEGPGPEYESLALLGANCLVDDLETVVLANDRCNRLGIDTISAGSFVAFSMECRERGLLTDSDCKGLRLSWGDSRSLLELVEAIGRCEGLGARFAQGILPAARDLGEDALQVAMQVKGVDMPGHDPRRFYSLAINYATSPQGASHLRGFPHCGELGMLIPEGGYSKLTAEFSFEGKAFLARLFQDYAVVLDSLVDCCFMQINGLSMSATIEALNAITGLGYDASSLLHIGERGFNLHRILNLRDGIDSKSDCLPPRALTPSSAGPRAGKAPLGLGEAILEYYVLRGWSNDGIPTEETLRRLDLLGMLQPGDTSG